MKMGVWILFLIFFFFKSPRRENGASWETAATVGKQWGLPGWDWCSGLGKAGPGVPNPAAGLNQPRLRRAVLGRKPEAGSDRLRRGTRVCAARRL
jgi:hypothetical protein